MLTDITARAAIVTGGGYGIGRATALLLAADGWRLLIVDLDEVRAGETIARIEAGGGTALAVIGDVAEPEVARRAAATAHDRLGVVQGLVTCAAARHEGPITNTSPDQWDATIKVILYGAFHFCREVIPMMIGAGGGAIVNVSSPDAFGRKNMVAYAAAKGAVNTLTLCLAADHLADRIRVNAVLPGFTLTGMTEHYPAERLEVAAARSVAGRPGSAEDVARLIRFLLSEDGATITGGLIGGLPLAKR